MCCDIEVCCAAGEGVHCEKGVCCEDEVCCAAGEGACCEEGVCCAAVEEICCEEGLWCAAGEERIVRQVRKECVVQQVSCMVAGFGACPGGGRPLIREDGPGGVPITPAAGGHHPGQATAARHDHGQAVCC